MQNEILAPSGELAVNDALAPLKADEPGEAIAVAVVVENAEIIEQTSVTEPELTPEVPEQDTEPDTEPEAEEFFPEPEPVTPLPDVFTLNKRLNELKAAATSTLSDFQAARKKLVSEAEILEAIARTIRGDIAKLDKGCEQLSALAGVELPKPEPSPVKYYGRLTAIESKYAKFFVPEDATIPEKQAVEDLNKMRYKAYTGYESSQKAKKGSIAVAPTVRNYIFVRDKYRCQKCGVSDNITIDHILPLSLGGKSNVENLQTLCVDCNSRKSSEVADYRIEKE
ncbi:MAG: HNH endonuclease [Oscillospiraceae bacterium]|jgi:hypothetical protein|nr:HNH endonuclease [Oscillospiraceae bacterium]